MGVLTGAWIADQPAKSWVSTGEVLFVDTAPIRGGRDELELFRLAAKAIRPGWS